MSVRNVKSIRYKLTFSFVPLHTNHAIDLPSKYMECFLYNGYQIPTPSDTTFSTYYFWLYWKHSLPTSSSLKHSQTYFKKKWHQAYSLENYLTIAINNFAITIILIKLNFIPLPVYRKTITSAERVITDQDTF